MEKRQQQQNTLIPMREQPKLVRKSNLLARATPVRDSDSPFSVWERRLVALVASKIRPTDTDFMEYRLKVAELLGAGYGGKDLEELEKSVRRAMRRQVMIRRGPDWVAYQLFTKCGFLSRTGTLTVCFHPDLKPHFLQLKQNYVQYELNVFLALPSVYSQGLFEILKSWSNLPEVTIPLPELHEMLSVPESMKKDFAQFRMRVLEKSKADMEKHARFSFLWEPIREGRSVKSIRFVFSGGRMRDIMEKLAAGEKERKTQDFIAASKCFEIHGTACEGGHQKDKVCEICLKLR